MTITEPKLMRLVPEPVIVIEPLLRYMPVLAPMVIVLPGGATTVSPGATGVTALAVVELTVWTVALVEASCCVALPVACATVWA